MQLVPFIRLVACKINLDLQERKFKKLTNKYDISGYKRIYCVHIRKTGGTSLNNMFLSLSEGDAATLLDELRRTPDHRLLNDGKVYVGWNARYIEGGNYFYGFSHIPFHKLHLPDRTFTVTCFRDPVKRVVSHYNMLMGFLENNVKRPCMREESKWLGAGFEDFLDRIPRKHLMNQLYMFSEVFDVDEAVANVGQLSHYFFAEHFQEGIEELNLKLGLKLKPIHVHRSGYDAHIPDDTLARLRDMLDLEYSFIDNLRNLQAVPEEFAEHNGEIE